MLEGVGFTGWCFRGGREAEGVGHGSGLACLSRFNVGGTVELT